MSKNFNEELIDNVGPAIKQAERVAFSTYGHKISVSKKAKNLIKFGRNDDVTNAATGSTIMQFVGGEDHETYISSNLINRVSSSSASDTEVIVIEGHTIDSNGEFTFTVQSATLQGQTQVTLTTPLARCTRIYNNNGTNLVGNIYVYQSGITVTAGVPQDGTKTHCIIRAGKQQSEKASTTISKDDYWLITEFTASVLKKTADFADFELQIRLKGKVFRTYDLLTASSGTDASGKQDPLLLVPPNSDVRISAVGGSDSLECSGVIHGYLASIVT